MPTQRTKSTGSPLIGEPNFLAVGRIRRSHGVRGEMLVEVYTDFPQRLQSGTVLYMGKNNTPRTILTCRNHKDGLLIAFQGITTPEQAGSFRNQLLSIPSNQNTRLDEGEYYHHQVIGLKVHNEFDKYLGDITEIIQTGANDVYVISSSDGKEVLIPVIPGVVQNINILNGTMHVQLPPGLLSE